MSEIDPHNVDREDIVRSAAALVRAQVVLLLDPTILLPDLPKVVDTRDMLKNGEQAALAMAQAGMHDLVLPYLEDRDTASMFVGTLGGMFARTLVDMCRALGADPIKTCDVWLAELGKGDAL